ncbi:hypothetical protein C5167_005620 [Papaver somniferum]|uniref:Uncharacterized protein n=1 Tax=Papaver somniferum TaxID=3469 RepID=A0A4Y7JEG6_PAPSO|nr:hypothetical protein C5167_005620 [Papaver somniferum]
MDYLNVSIGSGTSVGIETQHGCDEATVSRTGSVEYEVFEVLVVTVDLQINGVVLLDVNPSREDVHAFVMILTGCPLKTMKLKNELAHESNNGLDIVVRILEPIKEQLIKCSKMSRNKKLDNQEFETIIGHKKEKKKEKQCTQLYILGVDGPRQRIHGNPLKTYKHVKMLLKHLKKGVQRVGSGSAQGFFYSTQDDTTTYAEKLKPLVKINKKSYLKIHFLAEFKLSVAVQNILVVLQKEFEELELVSKMDKV